jgi:hypothetical protein
MHWSGWVKCQLRAYLCKELYRNDLLQELKDIENDIRVNTAKLSHMPRSPFYPSSTVERQAERREEIKQRVLDKLQEVEHSSKRMELILQSLTEQEREIIKWSYFSVDYEGDRELASDMGMSLQELERKREKALSTIGYLLSIDEFAQLHAHKKEKQMA